jgi:CRP-like cAMP-binding protein
MKHPGNMDDILKIISNTNNITPDIIELFTKSVAQKTVAKGTVLQKKGDKVMKAFYVKRGLLRSYIVDEKGREHIYMFAPEGWLITDVEMLTNHGAAMLFIDSLEDTEVEILNENIFKQTHRLPVDILTNEINKLMRRINVLQKRVLLLMSAPAEERYNDFITTYPQIVQRVPQKMIASYLGITPEALSKIKRRR